MSADSKLSNVNTTALCGRRCHQQADLTATSFSLQSCRTCSLLDLLTQMEVCPSQQARALKLQAQFLSATVFTSYPFAFALTYCWSDGGSDESIF